MGLGAGYAAIGFDTVELDVGLDGLIAMDPI
jgi:hypothetical protein